MAGRQTSHNKPRCGKSTRGDEGTVCKETHARDVVPGHFEENVVGDVDGAVEKDHPECAAETNHDSEPEENAVFAQLKFVEPPDKACPAYDDPCISGR